MYSSGKTDFGNATAGFFLGYSSGAYKFHLGDNTNYVKWDGSALTINGTLNITASEVSGLGDAATQDVSSINIGDLNNASTFKGGLSNLNNPSSAVTPIAAGDVNGNVTSISGGVITTGTINGNNVNVTNISASNINTGTLNANNVTVTNLSAASINEINIAGTQSTFTIAGSSSNPSYNASSYNMGVGQDSLINLTSGSGGAAGNTAVGPGSGYNLTTSSYNTLVGYASGRDITAHKYSDRSGGGYHTLLGAFAGANLVTGGSAYTASSVGNTLVGASAGVYLTGAKNCTVVGYRALAPTFDPTDHRTEIGNTVIGSRAMYRFEDGGYLTAVGYLAGEGIRDGNSNVAIGYKAGSGNGGNQAYGMGNTTAGTANSNVFVGTNSGYRVHGNARNNIFIGTASGYTSSSNSGSGTGPQDCTVIGDTARLGTIATNTTVIGANAYSNVSNRIQMGDSNVTSFYCYATLSQNSDERDKIEITENPFGLSFVKNISTKIFRRNPRNRYYDTVNTETVIEDEENQEDDIILDSNRVYNEEEFNAASRKDELRTLGFIAQELDTYIESQTDSDIGVVEKSDAEELAVREAQLIPILWKAVQELSDKNDALEARIATLEGG